MRAWLACKPHPSARPFTCRSAADRGESEVEVDQRIQIARNEIVVERLCVFLLHSLNRDWPQAVTNENMRRAQPADATVAVFEGVNPDDRPSPSEPGAGVDVLDALARDDLTLYPGGVYNRCATS